MDENGLVVEDDISGSKMQKVTVSVLCGERCVGWLSKPDAHTTYDPRLSVSPFVLNLWARIPEEKAK